MFKNINELLSSAPSVFLIIIFTASVSIFAFYNPRIYYASILHPYSIIRKKCLHTLVTAAFLHTGWFHLILNLLIIYIIGRMLEVEFDLRDNYGHFKFLVLYFLSVIIGNFGSAWIHRKDFSYRSAGASTGALAIVSSFCLVTAKESSIVLPFLGEVFNIYFILLFIVGLICEIRFMKDDHVDRHAHLFSVFAGMLITTLLYPEVLSELL